MSPRSDPVFSIRAPRVRLDRIDAAAKAAGVSRSQYMLDAADPQGAHRSVMQPMSLEEIAAKYPGAIQTTQVPEQYPPGHPYRDL